MIASNPPPSAVVVGGGFIGPVHAEALRRCGVRVLGIVGVDAEESRRATADLGLEASLLTLDDALNDPSVDSVHLATPNKLHYEQCLAVLGAGKHVLCEKPLAMTPDESARLVEVAADSGRAAGVCYNVRFYPMCHEIAARLRRDDAGELIHVTGSYCQDWLLKPTDFNWRVGAEEGGELRAVADIGTHWLDLAQFVVGRRVVSVCADLRTVHPTRYAPTGGRTTFAGDAAAPAETTPVEVDTDDCGAVMLRFEGGVNGVLWVSQTTGGKKNEIRLEAATTEQSLSWDSSTPNRLWVGHRDRANETAERDPGLLDEGARHTTDYPGGHNEGYPDTFKQLFKAFYGYIAAGDHAAPAPFPTFADGHHCLLLCEAVLRSHRERAWVDVRSI